MNVKLHATRVGEGAPLVLLHGLFGMGGNLGALARSLSDRYEVHSVDLPNHGRSDWVEPVDLRTMATCLEEWMVHQGLFETHLLGHSLGGKVAMELALHRSARVRSLVVADIAPVAYPARHDAVFAALEAVDAVPCHSRQQAARRMSEFIDEEGVIQFLLTSLRRGDDGSYRWRFNLAALRRHYGALIDAPASTGPYLGPALFIKGGDSDYMLEEYRRSVRALFPGAALKVMPGCGHWLHVQKPRLFNSIVRRFLDAQSA